ncbi:MAG: hypothetical protein R3E87_19785 [Burkholderiaceae bacterium]
MSVIERIIVDDRLTLGWISMLKYDGGSGKCGLCEGIGAGESR